MKSPVAIARNRHIEEAIKQAMSLAGGLPGIFHGRHVAIKPNDTWASRNDLTACTQADTLRAVIRSVKTHDPRAITVTGGAGAGETDEIFKLLGMDKVITEEGVEFFDHNRPPFTSISLGYSPQEKVMVNPRVLEYEALVSLAQHKVHDDATVTLTMKNIAMSFPAADYYGHPRNRVLHQHRFFKDLQAFIAGMCKRFPITLGIIAGHPAMTGKGPIGGVTFESELVIAGRDFVAVDAVGAKLLGIDYVGHIALAEKLGLGTAVPADMEFPGIPLEEALTIFARKNREAEQRAAA